MHLVFFIQSVTGVWEHEQIMCPIMAVCLNLSDIKESYTYLYDGFDAVSFQPRSCRE